METIHLTVIDRNNETHIVDFPNEEGYSLMEILKSAEFPVEGICGGMALCASCHIYIELDHILNEMRQEEILMLDSVFNTKSTSRLACQIPWSEKLDQLVIRLAVIQ